MGQRQRALARKQAARRRVEGIVVASAALALVVGAAILLATRGADRPEAPGGGHQVSMTEFAFDPDPIVLRQGDGATIEVVNDGAVDHDLVIGELGKGTPDLAPGEAMVLDLSDQPAGSYRVVCDLPGHTEAGMVTELTIE
jgi:plastocyanin